MKTATFARNVCTVRVCELDEVIAHLCDGAGIDTPTNLRLRCGYRGMSFNAMGMMFGRTMPKCAARVGAMAVAEPVAKPYAVLPNVKAGSWVAFPSKGVPYAPGEGHGWRTARVLSRKGATARVEWWNRRGVRHECTVSLSRCKSIGRCTAPTPESAAAKLRARARIVRSERLARRER